MRSCLVSALRPARMIPTIRPWATGSSPTNRLPGGTSTNDTFTYRAGAPVTEVWTLVTARAISVLRPALGLSDGMVNW